MRHIYTLAVVLFLASCSKDDQMIGRPSSTSSEATKVIDAAIVTGGEYQMPVTSSGTKIHKQAAYFETSSIGVDSKTNMVVYRYVPAKGFTGTDEVTLSETKSYANSSQGCNNHNSGEMTTTTTFVKIRFTVK